MLDKLIYYRDVFQLIIDYLSNNDIFNIFLISKKFNNIKKFLIYINKFNHNKILNLSFYNNFINIYKVENIQKELPRNLKKRFDPAVLRKDPTVRNFRKKGYPEKPAIPAGRRFHKNQWIHKCPHPTRGLHWRPLA